MKPDRFSGPRSVALSAPSGCPGRSRGTHPAGTSLAPPRWITGGLAPLVKTHGAALRPSAGHAGRQWHNPRYSQLLTPAQPAPLAGCARLCGSVVRLRSMLDGAYRRRPAAALAAFQGHEGQAA